MKLKNELIKEIDELDHKNMMVIYDMVRSIKSDKLLTKKNNLPTHEIKSRQVLKKIVGSLSDDINQLREERI